MYYTDHFKEITENKKGQELTLIIEYIFFPFCEVYH